MATVAGVWVFNETISPYYGVYEIYPGSGFWPFQEVSFTYYNSSGALRTVLKITESNEELGYLRADGQYSPYNYNTNTWDDDGARTIDFGSTEQEVSDNFYSWLTSNATQVVETTPTEITYNGVSTSLEAGQTATMPCFGKKMASDIVIAFGSAGTITYNGTETAVDSGQTATMECAGKKMLSDVVILMGSPNFAISGQWLMNETLDFSMFDGEYVQEINGQTDGAYTGVYIFDKLKIVPSDNSVLGYIPNSPYNKYQGFYFSGGWRYSITTLDFGEEPQEVTPEFYNWLKANATKQ